MHAPISSTAATKKKSDAPGVQIRLLGEFAFDFQGQAVAAQAWQRAHARRLLQLLCSAPKFTESRARVLSSLWPDSDDARARNRLHHTVHCVRKAWEEIPAAERPQIVVGADRVQFVPGPQTVIDVQVFLQGVESDCTDATARLAAIEHALERYKGGFAPGWDDCAEIERRRAWLEKLRAQALQEAVDTAVELSRPAVALHHAHQLALLSQSDCQAHCQYALLLADNQRPDAALLHCQAVRPLIESDDPPSLSRLDETIQAIQQRANRRAPIATAPSLAPDLFTADVVLHGQDTAGPAAAAMAQPAGVPATVSQGLVSRLCVAAPSHQALGYDSLVQLCTRCIADPYGSLTTVVGPPGSGKSVVAATVAHALQSQMQHGALWLDCTAVHDAASLLQVIAEGLDPLCGALQADEATLSLALRNKELLIVLDGLNVAPSVLRLASVIALAGRDTRWLVTSWSARHLLGERLVAVEASQLLARAEAGGPSQAAEILLGACAPLWRYQDARTVQLVEQICSVLDGLPQSLVIAGECLRAMSPSELMARLQRDPCALMRGAPGDVDTGSSQLARAVAAWLEHATPSARPLLSLLSQCRSWLTRQDIECLMGEQPGIDALIEHCVRHQFLLRRAQAQASGLWSEFRVPRIVIAALRLCHDAAPVAGADARIQAWLLTGAQFATTAAACGAGSATLTEAALLAPSVAAARWFDDHMADLDAAALSCIDGGRLDELAQLCLAHTRHWFLPDHGPRVQVWLDGLGSTMHELPPSTAATLLVARARLRVHLGELHLACDDASRALARIVGDRDADLRHQAVQLLQRYGACTTRSAAPTPKTLSGRGVEAGESLLRVSQLAVRHGQLVQALSLCRQAIEVFAYFGFSYGLIKAQHYRAKIAFALGDTDMASRCLTEIERVATQSNDRREGARAALMRAHVLMSQMRFSQAVELASSVLAQPECADDMALMARGTSVVAWSHYGQGAYPLAHALCSGLRLQAQNAQGLALRANTEILSALIEAQSRRPEAAIRSACAALELLAQEQPMPDAQSDLVNGAELAMCLGRADLAAPLMQSLDAFSHQPEHRLRDWVQARVSALKARPQAHPLPGSSLPPGDATAVPALGGFVPRSFSDVLADLTAA